MSEQNHDLRIRSIFYREAPSTYRMHRHSHASWQWYLLQHGDVTQTIHGTPFELSGGECVLIPPSIDRAPACTGNAPGYLMAIFEPGPLQLDRIASKKLTISRDLQPSLDLLIQELREPFDGHARLLIQSLTTHILIGLLREHGHHRDRQPEAAFSGHLNANSQRELVEQAIAYIQGNLHAPLNRDELAAAVHCSAPHFARLFKAHMGTTPGQYVTNARLERAKYYLRNSSLSISQIALEVGFQSFSHFTQLFRKRTDLSPSDYRSNPSSV